MPEGKLAVLERQRARPASLWYLRPSVLIPVLSLAFAIATASISYYQAQLQDVRERRAELRGLVQRFYEFPREHADAAATYADSPDLGRITDWLRSEENLIVTQATQLAESLQDHLSSAELYSVSVALEARGDSIGSERFAELAVARASVVREEIAALRQHARLLFLNGKVAPARERYQRLIRLVDELPDATAPVLKSRENANTLGAWAELEAWAGNCHEARQRLAASRGHFQAAGGIPDLEEYFAGVTARVDACRQRETE